MEGIDYETLLRNASISVFKQILEHVQKFGFYKKQHLYITFSLKHCGIKINSEITKDYDDEMTIVLQYEFWDLKIDDYGFSVSLAFDKSDETIYIPYTALITVSDPSEDFNLNFLPDLSDAPKLKDAIVDNSNIILLDEFRHN